LEGELIMGEGRIRDWQGREGDLNCKLSRLYFFKGGTIIRAS